MNLIAINLGLAPVPPLPPSIVERRRADSEERQRAASGVRPYKAYGEAFRATVVAMLRDTGPGTALDLAVCLGVTSQVLRGHLERLERDGLVIRKPRQVCGRTVHDWHAIEAPNA